MTYVSIYIVVSVLVVLGYLIHKRREPAILDAWDIGVAITVGVLWPLYAVFLFVAWVFEVFFTLTESL